jgi:hypothetical protein
VLSRNLHIQFVSSKDQLADVSTKAPPTPRFKYLQSKLSVQPAPSSRVGGGGCQTTAGDDR